MTLSKPLQTHGLEGFSFGETSFLPSRPAVFRAAHLPLRTVSQVVRWREQDERRGTSAERGYGERWRKARAGYLRVHPLCVAHLANGRVVVATVLDHIVPHKGDMALFWDSSNWQPLCEWCHRVLKSRLERAFLNNSGSVTTLNLNRPIDDFDLLIRGG